MDELNQENSKSPSYAENPCASGDDKCAKVGDTLSERRKAPSFGIYRKANRSSIHGAVSASPLMKSTSKQEDGAKQTQPTLSPIQSDDVITSTQPAVERPQTTITSALISETLTSMQQPLTPEQIGEAAASTPPSVDGQPSAQEVHANGVAPQHAVGSWAFAQPRTGSGAFAQPSGGSGAFAQPAMSISRPGTSLSTNLADVISVESLGIEASKDIAPLYRVGDEIGRGGCAVVYEAWRISDDLHIVLKLLHSNIPMGEEEARVAIKRFIREAEVISSLHEDHIVKCVDYGWYFGTPCMVLEFVDGLPLDQFIAKMGCLSLAHATGIIEQLLNALEETHSKDVIHRDIKPSNIMVFDTPPPYEIRVLDFGIASVYDNLQQSQTLLTQQGSVRGTPSYMAPELFTGESKASREADLYAAGLVYYEMLTGEIAFNGENFMRIAYKQVNTPLEIPGFVPPGIAHIIGKMCAKDAADRYHSASEALADIRANIDKALAEEESCIKAWAKSNKKNKDDKKSKRNSASGVVTNSGLGKPQRSVLIGLIAGGIVFSLIMVIMLVLKPNSTPTAANVPNNQAKVLGTIGSANAQETVANDQDNPDDGKANDEPNTGSESNADVEPTLNTGLETDDAEDANVNDLPIEPEPTTHIPVETDNPDDDDDEVDELANGDDKEQAQAHKEPTKSAAKKPTAKKPNKTSKPSKKADKSKAVAPKKANGNGSTPKDFDSDFLPF